MFSMFKVSVNTDLGVRSLYAILAAEWHWWLAVVLTPATVLTVLAVIGGYFVKVVRPKYPPKYKKPNPEL